MNTAMSTAATATNVTWRMAAAGARAHLPSLVAPFVVVALAGALVAGTGVLVESGLRAGDDGGLVIALATSFAGTALALVVFVVQATVSLALRARHRDFALLRAVGATRTQVRQLVRREVVLVTVLAAPLGALAGLAAVGQLTDPLVAAGIAEPGFTLVRSPAPVVVAAPVLLPVTVLAARLATRPVLRTSPTEAVAASSVEPAGIGRSRHLSAYGVAGLGLAAAFSPLAVPGVLGSAIAAFSAFLLVGAAALAGPALVAAVLDRVGAARGGPATRLALANTRGFSRRLTTVVVPLTLALGVGTVQASVDDALVRASAAQLTDGLTADLVVSGPVGDDDVEAVRNLPGVEAATPLARVPAQVQTDDESEWLGPLGWEPLQVLALPYEDGRGARDAAAQVAATLDPGLVDGDLAALGAVGTVSISEDAELDTGKGIGDRIAVRWDGAELSWVTVVAIHDRGLGFGDYLVGRATPAAHGAAIRTDTLLLRTAEGTGNDVVAQLHERGLRVGDEQEYVDAAVTAGAEATTVSSVLLLALMAFVVIGGANALVLATAGRRPELVLLWRTGATRSQLLAMATVEALLVGLVAWLVGTATVLPAVLGVNAGLLGAVAPTLPWTTYAWLSAAVVLVPLLTVVPVVARMLAGRRVPAAVAA